MSSMLPVSSPRTPARRILRGNGRGRVIDISARPKRAPMHSRGRIQPQSSGNALKSKTLWPEENNGLQIDLPSAYESTAALDPSQSLSGTGSSSGTVAGRPLASLLSNREALQLKSTLFRSPSKGQEPNGDECMSECEGTSMSGSFEDLSTSNKFPPTAGSSENLWILPLVGRRPRLDGVKHYDLVCEGDPLLLTYGLLSQALWIIEERLFNDPELNDEQKAMNALWTRWLALYRVDFIENARLCCINFVEHKHEIIYHAAGWHAFRSWILALKYNNYLMQHEMISIIRLYNQKTAQATCASSLPEAKST